MSRKKITAVIPIRKGSQRVPDKNFKDFYKGKSLLELKIESLKEIELIDDIVVNTDSELAIDIAKRLGVSYYRRDDYYASSQCSQSEFFKNLAETTDTDIIIHTPCTSPLINKQSIIDAINRFNISENDSCNSVGLIKEYLGTTELNREKFYAVRWDAELEYVGNITEMKKALAELK